MDDEDVPRSFNGSLDKFIHSPNASPVKSLKRKIGIKEEDEDAEDEKKFLPAPISPRRTRSFKSLTQSTLVPLSGPSRQSTRSAPPRTARKASGSSTPIKTEEDAASPSKGAAVSRLRDSIPENLVLLLIGVNPGIMTGQTGYAYAHPSNLYWRLLHSSGITTFRHPPSDTYRMPELYCIGNTNIVVRPTRDASQLSKEEMNAGVPVLEEKIGRFRPEAVCLVGKGIWEAVWRVKHGRNIKKEEFKYGWQDEEENMGRVRPVLGGNSQDAWPGARVFVATTTSGLAASMKQAEKEAIWAELGSWVKERREARGFVPPTMDQALRSLDN
ncbi:G/U mismatch-specific uracil DNA glycosylase [Nannizzia gypsea CBS 118893]|uniref:G/U mismatch-specific uracil DNA glycosylase n=1 Tax=Arthroderma gypseum (strain ATCC MYA-4604 / CBS 118893) TaxID=535722 RepID=E5QZ63_ARTGP|nr:G/U mismatch-specific uracil DNA glycosylase [Nannizzia gypsea CBS 118893]EFQ97295.1 G/U mismatch-specific uracil DNA glycosylase [Nannizzia gypsea CBS 118893]